MSGDCDLVISSCGEFPHAVSDAVNSFLVPRQDVYITHQAQVSYTSCLYVLNDITTRSVKIAALVIGIIIVEIRSFRKSNTSEFVNFWQGHLIMKSFL